MRRLAVAVAVAAVVVTGAVGVAAAAPALTVDAAVSHPVSPDIYGMNFADPALAAQIGLPVDRRGGNAVEAYNYLNSATNTVGDYYYENIAGCFGTPSCDTPVFGDQVQVATDRRVGAATLMELPLMGYVARDAPTDHPFTCAFPKSVFPTQDSFDPFDKNCGNGKSGGVRIDPGTPTRTGQAIDSTWDGAQVASYVARYGAAAAGGVRFYEPGNEPALWSSTDQGMHFADETNFELIAKFSAAAAAVRAADPSAKIVGPAEWGWINYFCDAESFNGGACHPPQGTFPGTGGTPVVAAFLDAMRASGNLDYFDLHYYPAGGGSDLSITRSLWDPSYRDPSYIDYPIDLIPRMKQWVADHDPGIKTSLSEYNMDLGGSDHVADTLLEADALGIFAREGLDMATEWGGPSVGDPEANAYRLYRDYDGQGAKFGDQYLASTSSDQSQLAIYAAQNSGGDVTIAVINKAAGALTAPVTVANSTLLSPAAVWQATGPGFGFARGPDVAVAGGATAAITFPAKSMTMVRIPDVLPHVPPADGSPGSATPGGSTPGESTGSSSSSKRKAMRCTVPTLTARTITAARKLLKAHHCVLGTVHHVHSSHRRGRILHQSPHARTTHRAGAHVAAWVSRGRARRSSPR